MLYVEDDPDVADAGGALLQSLGVEVRQAGSADAAVASDLAGVDLLFSDVMMPGAMDGIELARWLAVHHPALPVVLTGGCMLAPERLQDLQVQFVRKPSSLGAINDAFVTALRKRDDGGGRGERRGAAHLDIPCRRIRLKPATIRGMTCRDCQWTGELEGDGHERKRQQAAGQGML